MNNRELEIPYTSYIKQKKEYTTEFKPNERHKFSYLNRGGIYVYNPQVHVQVHCLKLNSIVLSISKLTYFQTFRCCL